MHQLETHSVLVWNFFRFLPYVCNIRRLWLLRTPLKFPKLFIEMSPNWKSLVCCTCLFRTMCLLHLSCRLSSGFQVLCSLKAAIGSCGCACSFLHSWYRNHGKVVLKHRPAECAPTIREMLNWCRKCRIKGKIVSVRYPTIAKRIQHSKSWSFFL